MRYRGSRGERGMLALEFAVLAPILLVLLLFLMACGRYFQTSSILENAARDGARAATQARTANGAQDAVDDAVSRALNQKVAPSCASSVKGVISSADFAAGTPITVEVSCTIDYRDLGLLGMSNDVPISRSFTSTLDAYRGVR